MYPVDSSRVEEGNVGETNRQNQITADENGQEQNAVETVEQKQNGDKPGKAGGPSNEQTKKSANDKPKSVKSKKND